MKTINSLEELNIPFNYKSFILHFLSNISKVENVSKVVLFGSCARGDLQVKSDIDILVIVDDEISIDEELYIMSECPPNGDDEYYVPADIIVDPIRNYNRFKETFGMLQKAVEREGVDLSELLR